MRLMIVTFDPPENVGGIEGRAVGYTSELLRLGHYVELVALSPGYRSTRETFSGATLLKFPSSYRSLGRSIRDTWEEMSHESIDSIFLLSGTLTIYGAVLLVLARLSGKRAAVFLYGKDILESRKNPLQLFLRTCGLFMAKRILTNSRFTAGLLPRPFRRQARVLYPSVDPKIANSNPEQSPDGERVLFVGRLVARKGLDDLLLAFKLVLQQIPAVELDIVGDGPKQISLKEMAKRLGIDARVRFLGELKGQPLYDCYRAARVFVMPSRTMPEDVEGFGTVFLEAAAFGIPSVGTDSGGIPEAIRDGVTGIIVPEGDTHSLARSLVELLTDDEKRDRLGQNARRWASMNFTWQRSTSLLARAFESEL